MIESFKFKLAEVATPLTKVPDEETHQPGEGEHNMMDENEDRQQ